FELAPQLEVGRDVARARTDDDAEVLAREPGVVERANGRAIGHARRSTHETAERLLDVERAVADVSAIGGEDLTTTLQFGGLGLDFEMAASTLAQRGECVFELVAQVATEACAGDDDFPFRIPNHRGDIPRAPRA